MAEPAIIAIDESIITAYSSEIYWTDEGPNIRSAIHPVPKVRSQPNAVIIPSA